MHSTLTRPVAALALMHAFLPALAGPPLSIDDPGILNRGQLEVITATTMTSTDTGKYYQVPLVDISLGIIKDHVQVAMVYPHAHAAPDNGRSEWDFGNLEVGVKWRFLNSGRLQMALAPYYVFGVKRGSSATGIGNNTDVMVFPVNAEYQINDMWRLNGELRYSSIEAGDDEWGYGAAVAYALDERWEYLFELSGTTDSDFDSDFLVARAGVDAAVTESLHLLFSIATGLRKPSGEDELNYDLFFGFQFLH